MTTVKWCCAGFRAHHETQAPGERGVSILFGRDCLKRFEVVLQIRGVDAKMEDQLPKIPIPLSLCTDVRLTYCPWCGANVEGHYERWADQLIRPGFRIELSKS